MPAQILHVLFGEDLIAEISGESARGLEAAGDLRKTTGG
jgi:hypothetical protein